MQTWSPTGKLILGLDPVCQSLPTGFPSQGLGYIRHAMQNSSLYFLCPQSNSYLLTAAPLLAYYSLVLTLLLITLFSGFTILPDTRFANSLVLPVQDLYVWTPIGFPRLRAFFPYYFWIPMCFKFMFGYDDLKNFNGFYFETNYLLLKLCTLASALPLSWNFSLKRHQLPPHHTL